MSIERKEEAPEPSMLDIIRIDGRWAQYHGRLVHYLDDDSWADVSLDEIHLVKRHKSTVQLLKELGRASFTDEEVARIHWDTEHAGQRQFQEMVTVFGEYETN